MITAIEPGRSESSGTSIGPRSNSEQSLLIPLLFACQPAG
jgi:hypothetical protein